VSDYYYVAPTSVGESLKILHQSDSKIRIAAGCTNIMPDLKNKKNTDSVFMDISGLEELRGIQSDDNIIRIGALTTMNQILHSEVIEQGATALHQACRHFADPLVRNRATVGGNLANASPAADSVVPLFVLNAFVTVESMENGKREIPLADFLVAPGKSVLGPDDLITAVSFSKDTGVKSCFIKFGLRKAMAISVISIGVALKLDDHTVTDIRIALGSVAPTPIRARQTESYLTGREISPEVIKRAMEMVKSEITPISDIRASKEYRTHLAGILLRRAVEGALIEGGDIV